MALTQLAATNAAAESKEKRDVNGFQWISGFGMHGRLPVPTTLCISTNASPGRGTSRGPGDWKGTNTPIELVELKSVCW